MPDPDWFERLTGFRESDYEFDTRRLVVEGDELQHPIVTARALATTDWLSSGRMTVTFGVGWLQTRVRSAWGAVYGAESDQ